MEKQRKLSVLWAHETAQLMVALPASRVARRCRKRPEYVGVADSPSRPLLCTLTYLFEAKEEAEKRLSSLPDEWSMEFMKDCKLRQALSWRNWHFAAEEDSSARLKARLNVLWRAKSRISRVNTKVYLIPQLPVLPYRRHKKSPQSPPKQNINSYVLCSLPFSYILESSIAIHQ